MYTHKIYLCFRKGTDLLTYDISNNGTVTQLTYMMGQLALL